MASKGHPASRLRSLVIDSSNPRSVAARARRRRFRIVEAAIEPLATPVRVLDVGGTSAFWRSMDHVLDRLDLTVLNADPSHGALGTIAVVAGDARDLSEFGDRSFDLVFSNSVIEHVGDRDDQQAMAREVQRVGRRWIVQTPCRWFPLEPHFLFPYFNLLPFRVRVALVRHLPLGFTGRRIPDRAQAEGKVRGVRLVPLHDLRRLFPTAEVHRERLLGLTKSYVLVGPPDPGRGAG